MTSSAVMVPAAGIATADAQQIAQPVQAGARQQNRAGAALVAASIAAFVDRHEAVDAQPVFKVVHLEIGGEEFGHAVRGRVEGSGSLCFHAPNATRRAACCTSLIGGAA